MTLSPRGLRRFLIAFLFLTTALHAGDFVKIDEDATHVRLQTAITRYQKNGVTVDLIGAIHIADASYYASLNQRFTRYDALLYEMIGGENIAARLAAKDKSPAKPKKTGKLDGLHSLYDSSCELLQLTSQADEKHGIDYRAKNFVHADLTLDQFETRQAERKESIVTFFLLSALNQKDAKPPNTIRLTRAILTKNPDLAKREFMKTLGGSEDQIACFTGENVIISDRNARCIEVLKTQLSSGKRRLAIFYGAAHFPDMEKRLLDLGFQRTTQEWLTAWEAKK
ncbi:MAG: hypothetical protein QM680_01900 [Luteolibacter sp.]